MTRQISQEGLDAIKGYEGYRDLPYYDSVGVLTVGFGHTGKDIVKGVRISKAKAEALLRTDLSTAENAVEELVKVDLTDGQHAALVSFVYNLGAGTLRKSTLLKLLNKGDYDAVPAEIMRFNRAGGRVLPGLTTRRASECGLWAKGSFVHGRDVKATRPQSKTPLMQRVMGSTVAGGTGVGLLGQIDPDTIETAKSGLITWGDYLPENLKAWLLPVGLGVLMALGVFAFLHRGK